MVGASDTFGPPMVLTGKPETMVFRIHGFPDREEKRLEFIKTNPVRAHGHQWWLKIYPRGGYNSSEEVEHVSLFLGCDTQVKADCSLGHCKMRTNLFVEPFGYKEFCKREDFLSRYVDSDGTATIEVVVDVFVPRQKVWYPELQQNDGFLANMYSCKDSMDVSFVVEDLIFQAHRIVLQFRAPLLFEFIEESSTFELSDTTAEVFEKIIEHIYTVLEYDKSCGSFEDAIELLKGANKFGCTDLKLFVESKIVDTLLTAENAASCILLADGNSCALLKEAAISLYLKTPEEVVKSEDWENISKSNTLLKEMLHWATAGSPVLQDFEEIKNKKSLTMGEISKLDVTTLRVCLQAANLELDGTQDMLKKRLTEYQSVQQKSSSKPAVRPRSLRQRRR